MTSADEELERLALNLQQSREKFFEWTGESFKQRITEKADEHVQHVKSGKEKLAELEENIKKYNEESERKLQALEQQSLEVENLEKQLRELQLSAQHLMTRRDNDKHHLNMLSEVIEEEKQDIAVKEEVTQKKLKSFNKGAELFRDNLGLEFKKIDADNLQFVFKYIDPNDWARPFTFTVCIDSDDRHYTVKDCMPDIQDLDSMVTELNTTDNFSRFVCKARNKFKEALQ